MEKFGGPFMLSYYSYEFLIVLDVNLDAKKYTCKLNSHLLLLIETHVMNEKIFRQKWARVFAPQVANIFLEQPF